MKRGARRGTLPWLSLRWRSSVASGAGAEGGRRPDWAWGPENDGLLTRGQDGSSMPWMWE